MTIYGQEMDNATAALARDEHDPARQPHGRDLAGQHAGRARTWKNGDGSLKTFDFAVANPPFSDKAWSNGFDPENDEYGRFEYGVPPSKNGDYAFLLHILRSLKSTGKGAIILPHGVLFRGNVEADIRREPDPAGLHQGHHRPAAQPLLRHRHPGLHHRARQGKRRRRARASS